ARLHRARSCVSRAFLPTALLREAELRFRCRLRRGSRQKLSAAPFLDRRTTASRPRCCPVADAALLPLRGNYDAKTPCFFVDRSADSGLRCNAADRSSRRAEHDLLHVLNHDSEISRKSAWGD